MLRFQYRIFLTATNAALLTSSAWAAGQASEQDYFQEFPVVLSASRLTQPQSDAPNAMTVIDRQKAGFIFNRRAYLTATLAF